jgi:predicted  nucleic acid-binding Zn-ribbon protein
VDESLQKLAILQDIDLMIRDRKKEEDLGFSTEGIEQLEEARRELAAEIDARSLRLYERLSQRYDRAIVPVVAHRCLGCSISVPTSKRVTGEDRKSSLMTCENCGRILFFV